MKLIFPQGEDRRGFEMGLAVNTNKARRIEQHPRRESSEFKDQSNNAGIFGRCNNLPLFRGAYVFRI